MFLIALRSKFVDAFPSCFPGLAVVLTADAMVMADRAVIQRTLENISDDGTITIMGWGEVDDSNGETFALLRGHRAPEC